MANTHSIEAGVSKCLLCGYWSQDENLFACSWCQGEASTLHPDEVSALIKLDEIEMGFKIWSHGRREDSDGTKRLPVEQPAQILPDLPLFIGDIDDSADVEKLKRLNVKCVINLCSELISTTSYSHVPGALADAGIDQLMLLAKDTTEFDIIPVAEKTFGLINDCVSKHHGVLVHCYGGINRSGAVAAAYLVSEKSMALCAAVECLRKRRGTVLTNQAFCRQLVQYCFQKGLKLLEPVLVRLETWELEKCKCPPDTPPFPRIIPGENQLRCAECLQPYREQPALRVPLGQ